MIKEWFNNLEQREKSMLMLGAGVAILFLLWGLYLNVHENEKRNEKRLANSIESLNWVRQTARTIQASTGAGADRQMRNKSLIQISEMAAGRSGIRSTRFQPNGVNDAQIWFEAVPFSALMQYISRMEQDFGVTMESVSISAAKTSGLINARIKFSK